MSGTTEPRPISDGRFARLVLALASGGNPDLSRLSPDDLKAVWRNALDLIRRRKAKGEAMPLPKRRKRLSSEEIATALGSLGVPSADTIVAEILAEPLLQAALWGLSQALSKAAVGAVIQAGIDALEAKAGGGWKP